MICKDGGINIIFDDENESNLAVLAGHHIVFLSYPGLFIFL